jgi:hypothetical protein
MLRSWCALSLVALWSCSGGDAPPPKTKGQKILSFEVTPASITLGEEVVLSWETANTSGVDIEPRIGLQPESGTAKDKPLVSTTYVLTIPGGPKELFEEAEVVVVGGTPRVTVFTATPRTIMQGESAALDWATTDADSVSIEPGLGEHPASGTLQVTPDVTTTYRLTATRGTQVSQPSEVTVVVASGNQPFIRTFVASPQTVQAGEPVTLRWETENSDLVTIDHGVGQQPVDGSVVVMPSQSTTYTITAVGPGGQVNASVMVTVLEVGTPVITKFVAAPATIAPGGQSELSWDTDYAESVTIDQGVGAQPAKGSVFVNPAQTTTYTLTAFGGGEEVTSQVTVTVAAPNAPVILTFLASPAAIVTGGSTTLEWTTQNVTSVDVDNGGGAGLAPNGTLQVSPGVTTTYTLTAYGTASSVVAQTTVTVSAAAPVVLSFFASPASIVAGGQATLSWSTSNATGVSIDNGVGAQGPNGSVTVSPGQTTQYTLTAMGSGGMATAQVTVSVTQAGAPIVQSFTVTPQQINPGGQATLSWSVQNATSVTIDNGIGSQPATGTTNVSPPSTTTYTLTAVGAGGQTTAQVTVTVMSIVGDTCADAFLISASGTFTGNTQTAADNYRDSNACTGYRSSGPDVVYRVALQAGDRIAASLQPGTPSWDASLYLVTSCANVAQSCVTGEDNGNPEQIDYTTASGGDFFLIVDGFAGAGGAFTLTVTLTPAPIGNDQCGGAIDVSNGGTFAGDTSNATGDYTPLASGLGGCTGYTAASKDVTYQVALAAGERLQASLDAAWDSSLYLVESCANASGTCVDGDDSGNPETVDFTAPSARTYFLIVDGYGTASGPFSLTVTISPPVSGGDTCQTAVTIPAGGGSFQSTTAGLQNDYSPPSACTGFAANGPDQAYSIALSAGDVVDVLAEFATGLDGAVYAVTSCTDLANTCVEGADAELAGQAEIMRFVAQSAATHYVIVDAFSASASGQHDLTVAHYTGDTCATASPLGFDGAAEWLTTQGKANDYSPNSGGCTGYAASGPDRAYEIVMFSGEQLHASLTSNGWDASLYLVSNCADVSGSCLAGSDRGVSVVEEIAPVFQQSGSYFVIVDGFGSANGTGTLTAEIRTGDACDSAYVVPTGGGTFAGTTQGFAADLGTGVSSGSCTGFTQSGADAVYEVSVPAGDTLTANLSATWDSALYLVSSCASSGTTCLAGQDNGNPETVTYTNNGGSSATYYLVVDSWRLSDTTVREGNYTLEITVQ